MVRQPLEDHVPPPDPDDALDHADVDGFVVEDGALLDVQLEIGGEIARYSAGTCEVRGIAADKRDAVAVRLSAVADQIELRHLQLAAHGAAPDFARLFVGEDHDLEGMACCHAGLVERLRDLDGTDRADLTVVVAAVRDRVDVGAQHQRRKSRISAGPSPDDVACRVDANVEAGVPHEVGDEVSTVAIGLAERDAANASLQSSAKAGECLEMRQYTSSVDV